MLESCRTVFHPFKGEIGKIAPSPRCDLQSCHCNMPSFGSAEHRLGQFVSPPTINPRAPVTDFPTAMAWRPPSIISTAAPRMCDAQRERFSWKNANTMAHSRYDGRSAEFIPLERTNQMVRPNRRSADRTERRSPDPASSQAPSKPRPSESLVQLGPEYHSVRSSLALETDWQPYPHAESEFGALL